MLRNVGKQPRPPSESVVNRIQVLKEPEFGKHE